MYACVVLISLILLEQHLSNGAGHRCGHLYYSPMETSSGVMEHSLDFYLVAHNFFFLKA